jgi:pantetheine-phosphate adenylyltransferase
VEITAIYPGSFDPITNGHIDIITRGIKIFDRIIIAIMNHPEKKSLFSAAERKEMIEAVYRHEKSIEVDVFDGLLVDYAHRRRAGVIVRGLRAVSDFEYEMQMAMMNRKLYDKIETVFMMPREIYSYLSSHLVREIASYGGNIDSFVPQSIKGKLRDKFNTAFTSD